MTILDAALTVLNKEKKPFSAQEIYTLICKDNLFEFSAKDPQAILKAQLRKNSLGFQGKSSSGKPKLRQLEDKKYQPL